MEFRLLGPVELWTGETAVRAGEPRQRAVLAGLVVDAGRTVGTDTLVDRVWGEDPPQQARRTLHAHISRIRAQLARLGAEPAPQLLRSSAGYRLVVEPQRVDLLRFRALVERARADGMAAADRAAVLREAVGLWRGSPLAGLSGSWAERMRESWGRERIDALLAWFDAEIRVGGAAAVLAAAADLVAGQPLLEPAAAALMRALHAVGRQSDALSVFTALRARLRDELGVDPGAELRAIHEAVLHDRPPTGTPPIRPVTATLRRVSARVPAQLPPDVGGFTGRGGELAALDALLPDAAGETGTTEPTAVVIAAIVGTAGVGKTALAVRWAHRVAAHFPDGQLYVNLRGYDPDRPVPPAEALAGFLTALAPGAPEIPAELTERAARFRSEIAGRLMLVVLDNAASAEQLRPLLPGTSGCLVLVTSRDSLAGLVALDGAHRLELDLLPQPDALALLGRLVGDRVRAEPDAALTLAQRCARLPLALRVAAELVISRPATPLAELATELGRQQRGLDLLAAGDDARAAVRAVFSWSVRQLPAATARTFRLLGLVPGPDVDGYAAAALADGDLATTRDQLDRLARAYLVRPVAPHRYAMHDLLKAYAAELAATDAPEAALSRLFDHYLAAAAAAMDALHPGEAGRRPKVSVPPTPAPDLDDPAAARAWLDAELANLAAVTDHGAAHDRPEYAVRMSGVLFRFLDGNRPDAALAIHGAAVEAAQSLGDPTGEANALNALSGPYLQGGDRAGAARLQRRALKLFEETDDALGRARTLGNLGDVEERLGHYAAAAERIAAALALFEQLGQRSGAAHALTRLGAVAQRVGHYAAAAAHLQRALELHRAAGHRFGEAWALIELGEVATRLGDDEPAVAQLTAALELFEELGDRVGAGWALTALGSADTAAGRHRRAVEHQRRALELFEEVDDRDGQACARNGLGEAAAADGRPADARDLHVDALAGATDIQARDQLARAHAGLAAAADALGDRDGAAEHYRIAAATYDELGSPEGERLRLRRARR